MILGQLAVASEAEYWSTARSGGRHGLGCGCALGQDLPEVMPPDYSGTPAEWVKAIILTMRAEGKSDGQIISYLSEHVAQWGYDAGVITEGFALADKEGGAVKTPSKWPSWVSKRNLIIGGVGLAVLVGIFTLGRHMRG